MNEINNRPQQIRLPILLAITLGLGVLIGTLSLNRNSGKEDVSLSTIKIGEVLSSINQDYVDSVNIDQLVEHSIKDMLRQLDPHTSYISVDQLKEINTQLSGSYDGIGIEFEIIRDTINVISPISGGPSEKAGLLAGDKIIDVNGERVSGSDIKIKDVTDRLMGDKGTSVEVSVLRTGQDDLIKFTIKRGRIAQPTVVASYMLDDDIGYIKVIRFGSQTYHEFKTALSILKEKGMTKLVLDLQGNQGGYMNAAEKMADEFIADDQVIVSQKGKRSEYNSIFRASHKGMFENQSVVVLIDEYSASASEIVAGALQDNDRALIVGRRSYGKGLVQLSIPLNDGSELRLTIARYFTPSGRSIQKPFIDGNDLNYAHDLSDRYDHGEFFSADSIHFNDSLKFVTEKGRVVYGGGGIMPDIFIPYDTILNSDYYNGLMANRVLREVSLDYYVGHRDELNALPFESFKEDFKITDAVLSEIARLAKYYDIPFIPVEYKGSMPLIKANIKAEIARMVWGENEYYQIYNPIGNGIFINSISLFNEATLLAQQY